MSNVQAGGPLLQWGLTMSDVTTYEVHSIHAHLPDLDDSVAEDTEHHVQPHVSEEARS